MGRGACVNIVDFSNPPPNVPITAVEFPLVPLAYYSKFIASALPTSHHDQKCYTRLYIPLI